MIMSCWWTHSSQQFCPDSNLIQKIKSFPSFFIVKGEENEARITSFEPFFKTERNERKESGMRSPEEIWITLLK